MTLSQKMHHLPLHFVVFQQAQVVGVDRDVVFEPIGLRFFQPHRAVTGAAETLDQFAYTPRPDTGYHSCFAGRLSLSRPCGQRKIPPMLWATR